MAMMGFGKIFENQIRRNGQSLGWKDTQRWNSEGMENLGTGIVRGDKGLGEHFCFVSRSRYSLLGAEAPRVGLRGGLKLRLAAQFCHPMDFGWEEYGREWNVWKRVKYGGNGMCGNY